MDSIGTYTPETTEMMKSDALIDRHIGRQWYRHNQRGSSVDDA